LSTAPADNGSSAVARIARLTPLLDLVGKNVASPEVKEQLARFPSLRSEVQDIAPYEGAETVHYLHSERDGVRIKCAPDGEIRAIFLMSEGKEGFRQYCGELPGDLSFDSTPEEAIEALGTPDYRRPAGPLGSYEQGELLRFDRDLYSLHLQFRGDGDGIDLVTVMTARSVPGRSHSQMQ
jgi:hypothetical protein